MKTTFWIFPAPKAHPRAAKFGQTQLYEIQIMMYVCLFFFLREPKKKNQKKIKIFFFSSCPTDSPVLLAGNVVSWTESSIVKSLRTHTTHFIDIHMIVLDKTRLYRSRHGYGSAGGSNDPEFPAEDRKTSRDLRPVLALEQSVSCDLSDHRCICSILTASYFLRRRTFHSNSAR